MTKRQVIYVAMTTLNYQMSGMKVLCAGTNKEAVQEAAEKMIGDIRTDYGTDLYRETEHKNLRVVSRTEAKRRYGFDWNEFIPDDRYQWIK